MVTVAEARLGLSASVTVTVGSTTTAAPPSVKVVLPAEDVTTGAMSGATLIVTVAMLESDVPSLALKVKLSGPL